MKRISCVKSCISACLIVALGCNDRVHRSSLQSDALDRAIIGIPPDYQADSSIEESHANERALGWSIAQKVWQQVALRNLEHGPEVLSIPMWRTWYDNQDLRRIFLRSLLTGGVSPDSIANAELWNTSMIHGLSHYSEDMLRRRINGITQSAMGGHALGGYSRTMYSPALLRGVVSNAADIAACFRNNVNFSEAKSSSCFATTLPTNSVAIKAAWFPSEESIPVYATDFETIEKLKRRDLQNWVQTSSVVAPADDEIFRMRNSISLDLRAMHIITKELSHWVWVSLWWSPSPDEDFGSDRPSILKATPLANYKMCIVVDFSEDSTDKSTNWCSNPYIETDEGLAATNCIGCHQYAGPQSAVISNTQRLTTHKVRTDNPFDYLWFLGSDSEHVAAFFSNSLGR